MNNTKQILNTLYGKSVITKYPEPSTKHFKIGESCILTPEIEKIVQDAYHRGCTYSDTDSIKDAQLHIVDMQPHIVQD